IEKQKIEAQVAAENRTKETIEEQRLAEIEKQRNEAQVTAENRSKETIEEQRLAEIEKQKIEAQVAAENRSKETIEEQRLAEIEKQKIEAQVAAENSSKESIEEQRLAEIEKQRIEAQNVLTNNEINKVGSISNEKQLKNISSPNSSELLNIIDESKLLEEIFNSSDNKLVNPKDKVLIDFINSTNDLLVNQIVLLNKIKELEMAYPELSKINNSTQDETKNGLIIQKIQLEELLKTSDGKALSILKQQLQIINNEIEEIENKQLASNIDVRSKNLTDLFEQQTSINENEISSLKQTEAYTDYLQKRIAFNEKVSILDSINRVIADEKQKLDFLLVQSNNYSEDSKLEGNKAKLISENIRLAEELAISLSEESKIIKTIPNQLLMEAMLSQQIQPIISSPKINPISYDFKIANAVLNDISTPFPIISGVPSGLIYRIQIGAFRKAVPNDKFREFSPVSGEVLKNGLTCYLAGFFNNTGVAITARNSIRNLGYKDAFIVAYCDGKRISLVEARELERSGKCIPKTDAEISVEVAALFKNSNLDATPTTISKKEDVYFAVQVGVYNKPITDQQLAGIEDLTFYRAPNGQYRYTSGQFSSFDLATIRKKAIVQNGIKDAYIVAYRNGERIDINVARNLIKLQDQTTQLESTPVQQIAKIDFNKLAPPILTKVDYVQFFKSVDSDVSSQQLGVLNRGGTFVYNPTQKTISSGFIDLTQLTAFERIYFSDLSLLAKTREVEICSIYTSSNALPSALHDWLIHCTIPHSILPKNNTFEIQFAYENEIQLSTIKEIANKFAYTYNINQL
ncbi:MAG: hypothetical protein NT109_06335, partial [Flavobacteriia bacterium]|nr:hypothetical protein [Flavobacteriia bacterium]